MNTVYILISQNKREMFYVKALAELYQKLRGGVIVEELEAEYRTGTVKTTLRLVA
jgi:hypothetical protein